MPGGPPLFAANLQVADANTGPVLISSDYINAVDRQLQEEKALGITAVMVQVGFPALYAPFYGGPEGLLPYQDFYQQVALAVRNAGLKLIVENDVLLTGDISGGWGQTLTDFYASSTFTGPDGWANYMAARATGPHRGSGDATGLSGAGRRTRG